MTTRPVRIDQIIPSIVEHDAVSNHTFQAQRILREMGFVSEIYARIIGPGTEGRVHALSELPRLSDGSQWVLYQSSIGSPAAEVFGAHPGPKLLDYHNITPAPLVEEWLPPLGVESRLGRKQLAELATVVQYSFADSPFNARELESLGYRGAKVVSVLIDGADLDLRGDVSTRRRLEHERQQGVAEWLFVGQVAPHKAQHDIVKALAFANHVFRRNDRLRLVGREMGSTYIDALSRFVAATPVADRIELAGSVSDSSLVAYYENADVFVCCSDHEGFCAPIVEAMARGLPVIAYGAAAVPETVGDAGIVLASKRPAVVAAAVNEVLADIDLRHEMVRRGRQRAALYSLAAAEASFRETIEEALRVA